MAKLIPVIVYLFLGSGAHGVAEETKSAGSPLLNEYGNPITGYFVDHNVSPSPGSKFGFELDETGKLSMYEDAQGLPPVLKRTVQLENGIGEYTGSVAEQRMSVKESGIHALEIRVEFTKVLYPLFMTTPAPIVLHAVKTERWTPRNDFVSTASLRRLAMMLQFIPLTHLG